MEEKSKLSNLEQELYSFSMCLLGALDSTATEKDKNYALEWARYHLWGAFQDRIDLQNEADEIHKKFKELFPNVY